MKAYSNSGRSLRVGHCIAVFTNRPDPVGTEFNVLDTHGNVLNVARVTHVGLSSEINAKTPHKYCVQAEIVQDMSTDQAGMLDVQVFYN